MAEFLVTWQIDIDADTPEEAAMKAFEKIRATSLEDPEGCAVFEVMTKPNAHTRLSCVEVDLNNPSDRGDT